FDLVASEWYALLAPAGTPKPVVAKLNAEMRRIMALPNLGERLAAIELLSSSPEELSDFIRGEIHRLSPVIQKLRPQAARISLGGPLGKRAIEGSTRRCGLWR